MAECRSISRRCNRCEWILLARTARVEPRHAAGAARSRDDVLRARDHRRHRDAPPASQASRWAAASVACAASTPSPATTCSPSTSSMRMASFVTRARRRTRICFWGLRGGGGNFGIVSSFEFQPASGRHDHVWRHDRLPGARMKELLTFFAEFSTTANDDMHLDFTVANLPGAGKMVLIDAFHGDQACGEGSRAAAPFEADHRRSKGRTLRRPAEELRRQRAVGHGHVRERRLSPRASPPRASTTSSL